MRRTLDGWSRFRQRCLLALAALLLGGNEASAAGEAPLTLFFELFGNGAVYSVNADYRLTEASSLRLGFGTANYSEFFGGQSKITTVPLLANYLRGHGNHWLEVGGGVTWGHLKKTGAGGDVLEDYDFFSLTGSIAYRYQRPGGGYFFKAGLTPFYSFAAEDKAYPEEGFLPWMGVAWGYSF